MKKLNNVISTILVIIAINLFNSRLYAEAIADSQSNRELLKRKNLHIYYTPFATTQYTEYPFRIRNENKTFSLLYGFNENFYLGFTYSRGESPKSKTQIDLNSSPMGFGLQDITKTRESEFFVLRSQYFFYGNFYGSANLGIEKGFKQEDKNFRSIQGFNTTIEPYSKTTTYSDRPFATIGLGYRKEVFGRVLVGIECEYGIMNSGRKNQHYTFNPQFYNGLPAKYIIEKFVITNESKPNSEFSYISIYAGIAI
ncbi:hypothetical protein JWG41_02935 [Leptospira sp. 201903075]|uniref:hypothetical protein n=1 Tax=Leptospira chreensis TaxID=2810035 RepID=UPI0019645603|nr:hypothetical protein [Leptospira chreensis]MBM9589385.1 hypothetical protein [Leptospira chreensis]